MTYSPLTPEQFQKAKSSGFSTEQIIQFEKQRKQQDSQTAKKGIAPRGQPVTAQKQPLYSKVQKFAQDELTGVSKDRGILGSIVQSSIGSRGLLGVAQLPGKVLGQFGLNKEQQKLDESRAGLAKINNQLIQNRRTATPERKLELSRTIEGNNQSLVGLQNSGQDLSDRTVTPRSATSTAINAGLTAVSGSGSMTKNVLTKALPNANKILSAGKGVIPRALEQGAIGAGFNTAENIRTGKPITENTAGAFALGAALPVAGTATVKAKEKAVQALGSQSARVINSLIKPLTKDFAYGKDAGRAVSKYGIVANSLEELGSKISETRQTIGQAISETASKLQGKGLLNLTGTLKILDNAMDEAATKNNSTLVVRIAEAKKVLTDNLVREGEAIISAGKRDLNKVSFEDAFKFKSLIGDMTRWTGNVSDDQVINKALKQVYGQTKETINNGAALVDKNIAKKLKQLNEDYADITSAEIATKYRDKITQRQNLVSLPSHLGAIGGGIATLVATGGAAFPALVAAFAGAGADKVLGSTAFKTRLAKWLSTASRQEKQAAIRQLPGLNKVIERIFGEPKNPGLPFKDLPNFGLSIKPVGGALPRPNLPAGWTTKSIPNANKIRNIASVPNLNPKAIDEATKQEMIDVIDYVRLKQPYNQKMEEQVGYLAEKYGITDKTLAGVANKFERLVEGTKTTASVLGRNLKGKGEIPNQLLQEAKKYKSAEEFERAYTQGHLMDLSNYEKHRFGRALPGDYGNNDTIHNIVNGLEGHTPSGYLTDIKYAYPDIYKKIVAPGDTIEVYRAVPKSAPNKLQVGDYIALSKDYAKLHGEQVLKGEQKVPYKIITESIPKTDVLWGQADFAEWAYSPQKLRDQYPNGLTDIWNKANQTTKAIPVYKGEKDLTTKILKDLEGKTTVSKQYILDATNRGELKQVERDIIRQALETEGSTVNVSDFAKKVKAELLPLKRVDDLNPSPMGGYKYENITLPDELRGDVENYSENIYESPIKTSAGNVHYSGDTKNYFGHTRIEDMADNKTRRVIEVQSDLYQKGNLEREMPEIKNVENQKAKLRKNYEEYVKADLMSPEFAEKKLKTDIKNLEDSFKRDTKDVAKLQQYNDPTAHFRMVREEIKKAAQDGKTKLQFPTGETAMKIEGLGRADNFFKTSAENASNLGRLEISDLRHGLQIGTSSTESSQWIITEVLGDGKFKAVPKSNLLSKEIEALQKGTKLPERSADLRSINDASETFDISGKVDQNNPIYKFYEKEVQRYLTSKFGGKRVKDAQGVEWIEVPINKGYAKAPIEAFGLVPPLLLGLKRKEE